MTSTRSARLLDLARLTNAQWFAVSAFESVIDLPARVAAGPPTGEFGPGSPARYHVPAAVPTFASVVAVTVRSDRRRRGPLAVALTSTLIAGAITGVLVGTVNVPLLRGSVARDERPRLVRRWHRGNAARLVLIAVAGVALERAARADGLAERPD